MTEQPRKDSKTFSEHIETTGAQLVATVKKLMAEGNARVLRIKEPDGHVMLEIRLTVGALAGGAVVLAAPWLAALGALAALASPLSIEIVRDAPAAPASGANSDSKPSAAA